MPGLYTLDFGISDEPDLSNRAPIDNAYEFEITFGRCEAADSRLTHGTASPASRSVDEAAQRALAEAWTRTLAGQPLVLPIKGRDREWGGMIYETGPGTGEFRYTRPFQGSEGEILASDLTTSFERVAALGLCEGRNFQLVGAYHTHPELPSLLLRYPFDEVGSHLSVGDIDFAIGKGHETGRPFAIYARGHNGDNCGIHKYKTVPGHLHVGVPANATEEEKVDVQEKDRRRDSAVWIPLQPLELKPAKSCTRDGMP